jgi:hypothetical protein
VSTKDLENRVAQLESQVSEMREQLQSGTSERSKPGWRRAVDKFSGDEGLQAIFKEAMKLREADRQRTRTRQAKTRKPKR